MFYPGEIVVCIEGGEFLEGNIIEGQRYVVKQYSKGSICPDGLHEPWVRLHGFIEQEHYSPGVGGLRASRFAKYTPTPESAARGRVKEMTK